MGNMKKWNETEMNRKHIWKSTGLALGVIFGLVTNHFALCLALGLAFGTAMDKKAAKENSNDNNSENIVKIMSKKERDFPLLFRYICGSMRISAWWLHCPLCDRKHLAPEDKKGNRKVPVPLVILILRKYRIGQAQWCNNYHQTTYLELPPGAYLDYLK